jgi:hypothetical protein
MAPAPSGVSAPSRQVGGRRRRAAAPAPVVDRGGRRRALAAVLSVVVTTAVLLGGIPVPAQVRDVALFFHLVALAVGFGAVVAVDWYGLLWMAHRRTLAEVLVAAGALIPLIWGGLTALVVTGALLAPDPSSPLTLVKGGLVLLLTVNGVRASTVREQLLLADRPRRRLLDRALRIAVLSQACWWGAMVIGFLNARR